jgi:hypothetical protein
MPAVQMTVHDDDSAQAEDGVLAAWSPIPCFLSQWQRRQWNEEWYAMTTVVVAWTTVPWHCWPCLTCLCKGVNASSTDHGAQQQQRESRRWCLGIIDGLFLPSPAMANTIAV